MVSVGDNRVIAEMWVGRVVRVHDEGFELKGFEGRSTHAVGVDTRPIMDGAEARALLDRWIAPITPDEEAPELPDLDYNAMRLLLEGFDVRKRVEVFRFLSFAPDRLTDAVDAPSSLMRQLLIDELSLALESTPRIVRRAIRSRSLDLSPLVGPIVLPEHEYIGSFTLGAKLVVADISYLDRPKGMLALHGRSLPGRYHAWVRIDPEAPARNVALLVAHEAHTSRVYQRGTRLGSFAVDGGTAFIVDAAGAADPVFVARLQSQVDDDGAEEAILTRNGVDVGCRSSTRNGDGIFHALAERDDEKSIVMIRVNLTGDAIHDHLLDAAKTAASAEFRSLASEAPPPGGTVKPYTPKERFEVGDALLHPKLGEGRVTKVLADAKIEVLFAEGAKTLVHQR